MLLSLVLFTLTFLPGCAISDRINALAEELQENGVLDTDTDSDEIERDKTDRTGSSESDIPPLAEKIIGSIGSDLTSIVDEMLICIQQNDLERAYSLCHPLLLDAGFDAGFEQLVAFCGDFEEYDLTLTNYKTGVNFSTAGKAKVINAEYIFSYGSKHFVVSVQYLEDRDGKGLVAFYLTPVNIDTSVTA